ncbi:coniferyl aldehyde dehydrogenase [Vibrio mexicanus]|uniref:coniferyl aldehyde dehydrogenase n=1 Tax=Vibrio mexicanus TaxID=1004326 RepID=UPI00063CD870|nr:coniferyl aldehyde dehydrogenase [Vibrio mexicanus]
MEPVVDIQNWNSEKSHHERDLDALFDASKARYRAEPYPDYDHRIAMLTQLKRSLIEHQQALISALNSDYGYRSEFDSTICDLMPSVSHINYTKKKLAKWMKPSKRHAGLMLSPSKLRVEYQPLGVVGVIVPWNFPIVLSIAPVVTALAAGNQVMVKLSEFTPQTNRVLTHVFESCNGAVQVVEGGAEIAARFSSLPFDHLLFTGSTAVGKLVAKSAAENLTPVTLELGGKSPVVIDHQIPMKKAVDAILLGKSINAGQICVAPDYVFVPHDRVDEFVEVYQNRFQSLYKVDKQGQRQMTHIINDKQHERLQSLITDAQSKGAEVIAIIEEQGAGKQMFPHLIKNPTDDMQVMQEEVFGPVLPIKPYETLNEAMDYITARPRPLALYIMSDDGDFQKQVLKQTHSGGVCINDSLLHVAAEDAPFGGIGQSGMGAYHGVEGFITFSHSKTVLATPSWLPRSRIMLSMRNVTRKVLSKWMIR